MIENPVQVLIEDKWNSDETICIFIFAQLLLFFYGENLQGQEQEKDLEIPNTKLEGK